MFLSYLLNNNKYLLIFILQRLLGTSKRVNTINANQLNDISCFSSESTFRQIVRPDMKVTTTDNSLVVYIENKIDSLEGQLADDDSTSQLHAYLRLAKSNLSKEAFVIYLTRHHEDIDQKIEADRHFAGQYTWSMVSDLIRNYSGHSRDTVNGSRLVKQFLDYLEVNKLSGTKGFKRDYAQTWSNYNSFTESSNEYLDYIANHFEKLGYKTKRGIQDWYTIRTIFKEEWNKKGLDGFWLNVGFELETSQKPMVINLSTELGIRNKYYQNIEQRCGVDLHTAILALTKSGFEEPWELNPRIFGRYVALSEITKDYTLSKDEQIKKMTAWVQTSIGIIEKSKLFKLLEDNFPSYSRKK